MKLEITFRHPDNILSPNAPVPLTPRGARVHNIKRTEAKTRTRRAAYVEALKALNLVPQRNYPARWLDVVWYYKGMCPDSDNVVARLKPLVDGCSQAFGINDRDIELGHVQRVHTLDERAGTLSLIFDTECKADGLDLVALLKQPNVQQLVLRALGNLIDLKFAELKRTRSTNGECQNRLETERITLFEVYKQIQNL